MKTRNVFAVAARALIALVLATACTAALADTYQYDERGDLETLTTPRGVRTYQYDEVQRLKLEQGYTGNREHVYDFNGNRATDGATAPGSPTAATYVDESNRIASINGAAVSIDDAGQITNDGVNTYTWDDAGRLKTVSRGGQLRATYHYDHKHRRTRKVTTAAAPQGVQTIRYHYDDRDRLMAETTGAGVPLRSYIWADDTLLAIAEHIPQGGGTYEIRMLYLELDHLGTPRQARIDGGTIVWRWESDGYGTSAANEDPDGNGQPTTVNLRFPGQYYDEESGLHYNWHRYYVPRLGRYLSSDPIGVAGGVNTYGYALGNPVSLVDPTGLDVLVCFYAGGVGHVGFGDGNPGNDGSTSGFYPKTRGVYGPGEVRSDIGHSQHECTTLPAEPKEDECMQSCRSERQSNPGTYNIFNRQCTSYVRDCLAQCGLPSGTFGPGPEPWYRSLPGAVPYPDQPQL